MTLIIAISGKESLWLLADRRLSYEGRPPSDDARKIFHLATTDGMAIVGYAGLGATKNGTEPSDWMSAVLRGRHLTLEESLRVLANAIQNQLPYHLESFIGRGVPIHNVIITALVNNTPMLYTIDIGLMADGKPPVFRFTRYITPNKTNKENRTPRICMGGSGAIYLNKYKQWFRPLMDLLKACDHQQISSELVADYLAKINYQVYGHIIDKSVGPRCIVTWRHSREGIHKGGGKSLFYTGITREREILPLPEIGVGMDINAIGNIFMKHMKEKMESNQGLGNFIQEDTEKLNEELSHLPDGPNEELM